MTGRPTKYKDEYADQAFKFCLLGATNDQLAQMFDVGITTIERWIDAHEEFRGAIRKGKHVADAEIASSLYHRAKGYEHDDLHISNYQGDITKTEIVKRYPPDTAAAFIWLKNRAGWTDKHQVESNVTVSADHMTDAELEEIANKD